MTTDIGHILALPEQFRLICTPIALSGTTSRREAETQAVHTLIHFMFGPEARLLHNCDGSPYISGGTHSISVSHTRTHAFLAAHAGNTRFGIDAEEPREQLRRVAPRFLSQPETAAWHTLPQLVKAWTIKEAVYKAAATPGLPLTSIALPHDTGTHPCTASLPDGRRFRLYCADFSGMAVAVAVPM